MAVDAVFDSVSVVTTFKDELKKAGVIFCSISEALREHPELVRKYLGSVVPQSDNFYASLNSAVFSDGSFVYVPEGVRCPMELSTYFRINEKQTGQFERTLIIADKGSYVSYLEGCTAPMRDEHQLHAAVVELIALDDAEIKYSTVQNWYPGDKNGKGGIYNFVTKRGDCRGRNSKISWTQVETGSAITWKYPSCILRGDGSRGEFYSIAVSNGYQQVDSGTKMIHLGKNTSSRIISKGIAAGHSQNTYRGLVSAHRKATNTRNFTNCDSLLIGDKCGAHTVPYIEAKNSTAHFEHEATTSKISDDKLFYCRQRGLVLGGGGGADRQRLRARRAAAAADGIHGRDAKADRHLAGRLRGMMRLAQATLSSSGLSRGSSHRSSSGASWKGWAAGHELHRSDCGLRVDFTAVATRRGKLPRPLANRGVGVLVMHGNRGLRRAVPCKERWTVGLALGKVRRGVVASMGVGSQPGFGGEVKHSRINGERRMRDAAEMVSVMTAKLRRQMDEGECKRRNALSKTSPGLVLRPGDVVTVVETFGTGEAFLVEFNKKGRLKKDSCDWMGVLYPTEIEVIAGSADSA